MRSEAKRRLMEVVQQLMFFCLAFGTLNKRSTWGNKEENKQLAFSFLVMTVSQSTSFNRSLTGPFYFLMEQQPTRVQKWYVRSRLMGSFYNRNIQNIGPERNRPDRSVETKLWLSLKRVNMLFTKTFIRICKTL